MSNKLSLSNTTITLPLNLQKTVTVQQIQRNGFEVKVRFVNLSGVILKSFVAGNDEVEGMIKVYASRYNFKIVD